MSISRLQTVNLWIAQLADSHSTDLTNPQSTDSQPMDCVLGRFHTLGIDKWLN
jgi:hypothetical protein